MKKDYRKLVAKGRVFLIATEFAHLLILAEKGFVFLDTVFDKEVHKLMENLVHCDKSKMVYFPSILKDKIDRHKIPYKAPKDRFYDKMWGLLRGVYDLIAFKLALPNDFGIGILHYTGIKKKITKEDGSVCDMPVFTCYSFPTEFYTEIGDDFLLYLDELKKFIRLIESSNQTAVKEAIKTRELDLKGWKFLDTYLGDSFEVNSEDIPPCNLLEVEVESTKTEEIVVQDGIQEKVTLFLLEYVMNLCEASKTSVDNVTYTPKGYLMLYATKNNHTKIKLSPSQMAMYCYIQGFNNYGISKKRLIEDINSHHGKYSKLCMLFCARHTDYDMARLKVVVTQINSKIREELVKANEGQESFDFTLWTDKLLIKSRNKQRYYIGVSERKFKPVIVDENRRFVESPYEFIDKLLKKV